MKRIFATIISLFTLAFVAMPSFADEARPNIIQKASVSAVAASGVTSAATTSTTVTVPGAVVGDACVASHPGMTSSFVLGCSITAANTATVTITQVTTNGAALSSGTLRVWRFPKGTR